MYERGTYIRSAKMKIEAKNYVVYKVQTDRTDSFDRSVVWSQVIYLDLFSFFFSFLFMFGGHLSHCQRCVYICDDKVWLSM